MHAIKVTGSIPHQNLKRFPVLAPEFMQLGGIARSLIIGHDGCWFQ